jgi:hypothetical protein
MGDRQDCDLPASSGLPSGHRPEGAENSHTALTMSGRHYGVESDF